MAERKAEVPAERRIEFRIGINLGDIIIDEDDIFGDGVNIAAHLEALAAPGGICVNRVVRAQVRDKLDIALEDMGEQQVKNIARPVRAFRIVAREEPVPEPSGPPSMPLALSDKPSLAVPFENMTGNAEQDYFVDRMVEEITTAGRNRISRPVPSTARPPIRTVPRLCRGRCHSADFPMNWWVHKDSNLGPAD